MKEILKALNDIGFCVSRMDCFCNCDEVPTVEIEGYYIKQLRDVKSKQLDPTVYRAIKGLLDSADKFIPKRILKSGDRMIVFWLDGTKTIVKRAEDEPDSDYAAFTAALAIKIYGSNSKLKRIVESAETQKKGRDKNETARREDGQNAAERIHSDG